MRINKRKSFAVVIMASILFLCIGGVSLADIASGAQSGSSAESGVASVNGVTISRDQFDNALSYQVEMAAIQGVAITDDLLPAVKYEVRENLISQELLYQDSRKFGITISDDEINAAFEERKQKANFDTDAEFEAALKTSNKTITSYRNEIKQGLAIDRFVKEKFTNNTEILESEARRYYDENPVYFQQDEMVRASHVMVRFEQGDAEDETDARKKIEAAKKRLAAGEDFSTVAGDVSEDDNSSIKGGDLGYLSKGQTPQSFETVLFALAPDEISDIVETDGAFHIIKVTEKQAARTVSFEEVKDTIINSMRTSTVNSLVESYLKELTIKATIVTYPID